MESICLSLHILVQHCFMSQLFEVTLVDNMILKNCMECLKKKTFMIDQSVYKCAAIGIYCEVKAGSVTYNPNYVYFLFYFRGLKCLVVPMLANMLESDKRKRWTFEQFFGEVFKIRAMLTIRLYDCSVGSNLKIYVEKGDR